MAPKPQAGKPAPPAFWIADRPLPVAGEMGAEAMHARAFNEGDRVPHEHVERYGWQDHVHAPDAPAAPDKPGGTPPDKE